MSALAHLLTPQRTVCSVEAASKKRLFEMVAGNLSTSSEQLVENDIYQQLLAREKLGSTGLGGGVAIPHCRIAGCEEPLGALITLREPVDYDSPDGVPVDLVYALIVPEAATQTHLDILAALARQFSSEQYCAKVRAAQSDSELMQFATENIG